MTDESQKKDYHLRFHVPFAHANSTFGNDWFGTKAEACTRFFGTPLFLLLQTAIVVIWVATHMLGFAKFDVYPFILLNLAFSLQSAYAAPLILLAQTRQADRDHAHAEADALHKEALALASEQRELLASQQTAKLLELMQQNTSLTEITRGLSERIEALTREIHDRFVVQAK